MVEKAALMLFRELSGRSAKGKSGSDVVNWSFSRSTMAIRKKEVLLLYYYRKKAILRLVSSVCCYPMPDHVSAS
jgi:hypothetical protein